MRANTIPEFAGNLRKHMLRVPEVIHTCSGIKIFGKLIRSIVFTTDVSIIRNVNADAVIAVYPFTPQPIITQALMLAADLPVFCGVGGGTTTGVRVQNLALHAEFQGAIGVVVNAPTLNETVYNMSQAIDIPIAVTVVTENDDIAGRIEAGAAIFNVSAASRTPWVVESIRVKFPDVAIIATGGPTDQTILDTVNAGANSITWTPPTNGELFRELMTNYREGKPRPHH